MVFLAPAKWQALHSSVCTVNYGKAKRPWRTQHGKAKWRFHPTPIKTTTQIRREEKLFASADGPLWQSSAIFTQLRWPFAFSALGFVKI